VKLLHRGRRPGRRAAAAAGRGPTSAAADRRPARHGRLPSPARPTARRINRTLRTRDRPMVPLIAETGGQNAMIVDSTALPEQVVAT
jgi:RHH-type proline utilization regulon transcriptional repressor/proline dehydrogenase/delta 1-pyrroline-5-carboxylate dehydrogenase